MKKFSFSRLRRKSKKEKAKEEEAKKAAEAAAAAETQPEAGADAAAAAADTGAGVLATKGVKFEATAGGGGAGGALVKSGEAVDVDAMALEFGEELRLEMNADGQLSRSDIERHMPELAYVPKGADAAAAAGGGGGRSAEDAYVMAAYSRQAGSSGHATSAVVERPKVNVALPYAAIEVVFNPTNLWVSCQNLDTIGRNPPPPGVNHLDPAAMWYDFDRDDHWRPFVSKAMTALNLEGCPPAAFYQPSRLAGRLADDRLRGIEKLIDQEIRYQVQVARNNEKQEFNQVRELVQQLEGALAILERQKGSDPTAADDFARWKQQMTDKLPPRSEFKGRPTNFAYVDAKRVRKHLFSKNTYHTLKGDLEYIVVVKCFGYYGGICSLWVYYGVLDRNLGATETKTAKERFS